VNQYEAVQELSTVAEPAAAVAAVAAVATVAAAVEKPPAREREFHFLFDLFPFFLVQNFLCEMTVQMLVEHLIRRFPSVEGPFCRPKTKKRGKIYVICF